MSNPTRLTRAELGGGSTIIKQAEVYRNINSSFWVACQIKTNYEVILSFLFKTIAHELHLSKYSSHYETAKLVYIFTAAQKSRI